MKVINRTMAFLPQLKAYLKGMGEIYTVRKYKMADATVDVWGIGECHRIPLGVVKTKEDLITYVGRSGFSTLDDWWDKIRDFIPDDKDSKYLYKVEVTKPEEGRGQRWVTR